MSDEMNSFTQSVYVVGEGVEVPVPDEGDAGKFLTAGDDGSVSWESGGGGGALTVYTSVYGGDDDYTITASFDDVMTAVKSGSIVGVVLPFAEYESPLDYSYGIAYLALITEDVSAAKRYVVKLYVPSENATMSANPDTSTEPLNFVFD